MAGQWSAFSTYQVDLEQEDLFVQQLKYSRRKILALYDTTVQKDCLVVGSFLFRDRHKGLFLELMLHWLE